MMIRLSLVLVILLSPLAIYAESFDLSDGMSIQDTIDLASDGDTINLAAGTYTGDIDFRGKAISVVGQGRDSVINGSGEGPVVNFDNGEGFLSLLDQVRVTGGKDEGAVHIKDSSPRVNRSWILANKSLDHASGIFIENGSPTFFNNVISNNRRAKGGDDPHQVYIDGASPNFINNTIIRGDSNGIFITGDSAPRLSNNIIAYNGKGSKGRGICIISFSNGLELDHNLFFRNLLADIFAPGSGGDFNIEEFEELDIDGLTANGNVYGHPRFKTLKRLRNLNLRKRSAAVDAGDPDELLNDTDGSRNDIGATGGSFPIL